MKDTFIEQDGLKSEPLLKSAAASFKIVPLDIGDEAFLQQALRHMIHMEDGGVAPLSVLQEPRVKQYIENWEGYPGHGFMAVDNGHNQPIGAVWIRYFVEAEPGYGFVREGIPELSLVVMPDHRGKGIGTALLQTLLESLPKDLEGLSLSVSKTNPAKRLYEGFGFKSTLNHSEVEVEADAEVDEDSLIMLLDQEGIRAACSASQNKKGQSRKKGPLVAGVVLAFLVVATFGLGPIDLSLYSLKSNNSLGGGWSHGTDQTQKNYHIEYLRQGQVVWTHEFLSAQGREVNLKVVLEPSHFKGNFYTPFYKHFTVSYGATLGDVKLERSASGAPVMTFPSNLPAGHFEGTLQMEIIGLCSIGKAKKLAEEEILKQMVNQVATGLQTK